MEEPTYRKRFPRLGLKQWLWILILVPGIPFAAGSLFIVAYSNLPWPFKSRIEIAAIGEEVTELIVLVHGKGDSPSSWSKDFASELDSRILSTGQQVMTVDWGEYSKDLFRSTLNGRHIGHDLGRELGKYTNIRKFHLIGHSAGAFVIYGMCEMLKKYHDEVFVQTTYLDPAGIYGGIDWGFGFRNFGKCADISDAYIDNEDEVPGSNAPLKHPHTFDVTALKKEAGFVGSPHLWPVNYYRRAVLDKKLPFWGPDTVVLDQYPPSQHTVMY